MKKSIRLITAVMLIIIMAASSFTLAETPNEATEAAVTETAVSEEENSKTEDGLTDGNIEKTEELSEQADTEESTEKKKEVTDVTETEKEEVRTDEHVEAKVKETEKEDAVKAQSDLKASASAGKAGADEPFMLKSITWKITGCFDFFQLGYHQRTVTHINDVDVNTSDEMKTSFAFCVEPAVAGPEGYAADTGDSFRAENGKDGIRIHTYNADNVGEYAMMRKMCFYLVGGYGWNSRTSKWYRTYMDSVSENEFTNYTLSATVLAKQWEKDVDDPEGNANIGYRDLSDAGKALVDKFLREVPGLPDPPKDYIAFYVEKNNCQDIWGSLYAEPDSGNITVSKKSAYPSLTDALPANYTLKGAKYYVYSDSGCKTRAKDLYDNDIVLTTDKNGKTSVVKVAAGDYWIKEVTPSKGFELDKKTYHVTVTADKTETAVSTEQPVYANFNALLEKQSEEYGYRRLIGAEYTLCYYDTDPETKDITGLNPKKTWVFRTREGKDPDTGASVACIDFGNDKPVSGGDMYKAGDSVIMPSGVFTLKETKAPRGLAADKHTYMGKVIQSSGDTAARAVIGGSDTLYVDYSGRFRLINTELEKTVKLIIQKKDAQTGKAEAQGQADDSRKAAFGSLEGAVYEVYMNDPTESENPKVGEMVTDSSGRAELSVDARTGRALMPGLYYIKEIKASPGYVLDSYFETDEKNKYQDGMHIVNARVDHDPEGNVYDYITDSMEAPHHTVIHKTDVTSGKELPGAKLQVIDSDGNIVEEWISTDKPHDIAALPDGKYILREITAPYGYETGEDVEFELKADEVSCKVVMKNKPVRVTTTAKHDMTDSHSGFISQQSSTITDSVIIEGVRKGGVYRLTGVLMDKASGNPVKDSNGKPVMREIEFKAEKADLRLDLVFPVDQKAFTKDTVLVVFEKLYRVETDEDGQRKTVKEIQKHEDLTNEDQSIHYGGIVYTKAVDKKSNTHNAEAGKYTVITDHVQYRNLSVKEKYTVMGELFDKTTGKLTGIKASGEFTPDSPDGGMKLDFSFDSSEIQDHDLVVFERLYVRTDIDNKIILVDKHENPEDKDQTVHIGKKPNGPKTGDNTVLHAYLLMTAAAFISLLLMIRKKLS